MLCTPSKPNAVLHASGARTPTSSSNQLGPLTQLAAQQPQVLADIVSQPAVWIAYTPLAIILLLLLYLLRTTFWTSLFASAVSTSICVLYAAQQRLLLGRQEQLAVRRAKKAVAASGEASAQQQSVDAGQAEKQLPSTQIILTLLGAEITDSMSAEGQHSMLPFGALCMLAWQAAFRGKAMAVCHSWHHVLNVVRMKLISMHFLAAG